MDLYFYTKKLDVAATSLSDLAALITALGGASTAANAAVKSRIAASIQPFVQSDSGEPLNLYFYDDASTPASWVTDATTTLAAGLGKQDPASAYTHTSTNSFTISGNSRRGTLALNTTSLAEALEQEKCVSRPGSGTLIYRTLHLRKTTAAGVTETVGLLSVAVQAGVLSSAPSDPDETEYLSLAAYRAGAVIHLGAVTSLTGGGATALDGITAGEDEHPVGCIRFTSSDDAPRHWKLAGTYIAASDVDNGLIKPTNSDATLNPVHWKLLQ
jgi:hypothetical protein